jgi:hypothetical protein
MRGDNAHCRRNVGRIIRELEQMIRDALEWNRLHPEHRPLDVEPDRVALAMAREARRRIIAGDREGFSRKLEDLIAYGRSVGLSGEPSSDGRAESG